MLVTKRTTAIVMTAGLYALATGAAWAEPNGATGPLFKDQIQIIPAAVFNSGSKKATTQTEVLEGKNARPMLSLESESGMLGAIARYESIVAAGGWQSISGGKMKVGAQGEDIAALKRRLYTEGYVNEAAISGEQGQTVTEGTITALKLFQVNHGLAATGKLDKPTLEELNVSAARRLATLRANLPRVQTYAKGLGDRYIVVNIPALQLDAVSNGRVFSRHNIIAGKPDRASPVVITKIKNIAFSPYWNVPVSIVKKDLIPQILKSGTSTLRNQNIRVFDGYKGPEVDPDDVDWETVPADRYFLRQDPGPDNAMATMKINFDSPFGVYMHDTPLQSLFSTGERLQSSGCVRIEKIEILANWILNGQDGWNPARIAGMAESQERLDVEIADPPQLRWAYLTAWATPGGHVNFRPDIYKLDGSGYTVGQPLPPGEYSETGERFVLTEPPHNVRAEYPPVDDGATFFKPKRKSASIFKRKPDQYITEEEPEPTFSFTNRKKPRPTLFSFESKEPALEKRKKKVVLVEDDDPPEVNRSVIANLKGTTAAPKPRKKAALTTLESEPEKKKKPAKKAQKTDPKKKKKPTNTVVVNERGPVFGQD